MIKFLGGLFVVVLWCLLAKHQKHEQVERKNQLLKDAEEYYMRGDNNSGDILSGAAARIRV